MSTAGRWLVRAELRLMTRDPLVLTFVFAFPIVTMLPARVASYRERGVLRRFATAGFPR